MSCKAIETLQDCVVVDSSFEVYYQHQGGEEEEEGEEYNDGLEDALKARVQRAIEFGELDNVNEAIVDIAFQDYDDNNKDYNSSPAQVKSKDSTVPIIIGSLAGATILLGSAIVIYRQQREEDGRGKRQVQEEVVSSDELTVPSKPDESTAPSTTTIPDL